ncbi:MAG: hypothetical protein QM796_18740 [Chthoniobacteraceae bacterium]
MSNSPAPFTYVQKGRSVSMVMITLFVTAMAAIFFLTRDVVFMVLGVAFCGLALSGFYAFIKGETWSLQIEDGLFSWSYARWPRSSGTINLQEVLEVVVDDCSSRLTFTFPDGRRQKIHLIGNAAGLRNYLVANYPHLRVKFVEGT